MAQDESLWTLARIVAEEPALAPLARLHLELAEETTAFATDGTGPAPRPAFTGPPGVHWLSGRALLSAAHPAVLRGLVEPLFGRLAARLATAFPEVAGSASEVADAVLDPAFEWPRHLRDFTSLPGDDEVPHPPLFRFLLLRSLAAPATHLARAFSPPHAERWVRAACPFCGLAPAASLAAPGGDRRMLCVLCGGSWTVQGLGCPACGEESANKLRVLAAREAGPASLEACDVCSTGWKVFHESYLVPGPPLAMEILTVRLDLVAERDEGIRRDEAALAAVFPPE